MGVFPKELKNEFETAVVNEPSVVEALNVYCNENFEQIGDGLIKEASFKQLLCFFFQSGTQLRIICLEFHT